VRIFLWAFSIAAISSVAFLVLTIMRQSRPQPPRDTPENHQYILNSWKSSNDPAMDQPLPGVPVTTVAKGQRILVVAIGACESCTAKTFDARWLEGVPAARMIALYEGIAPSQPEPLRSPFTDRVYVDADDFRRLNALWPRLYVLDDHSRLIAAQHPDDDPETFVQKWFPN
jgi:hypothetical protein